MKKKFLVVFIALLAIIACAFGLAACAGESGTYYKLGYDGKPDGGGDGNTGNRGGNQGETGDKTHTVHTYNKRVAEYRKVFQVALSVSGSQGAPFSFCQLSFVPSTP